MVANNYIPFLYTLACCIEEALYSLYIWTVQCKVSNMWRLLSVSKHYESLAPSVSSLFRYCWNPDAMQWEARPQGGAMHVHSGQQLQMRSHSTASSSHLPRERVILDHGGWIKPSKVWSPSKYQEGQRPSSWVHYRGIMRDNKIGVPF